MKGEKHRRFHLSSFARIGPMAIDLPVPMTVPEIRVLQEYRRLSTQTLTLAAIKAIKHPAGGGEEPARTLAGKGYLAADGDNYTLTEKAREFLAYDPKPLTTATSASSADETAE